LAAFGSVPVGLYQDEAFNGLDALRVLAGEHPLYFTANNGREPFFIYLASISIARLGRTVAAVRLPAALLGTLTIPATALLGRTLFSKRVGILASALVAITLWPLHLSRIAFRAVGLPLFLALSLAAGWHGVQRKSRNWIIIGGLLYGLAFYTYLAVYLTPVVLFLFALYLWIRGFREELHSAAVWFGLGTALALLPLAYTFLSDPALLFGRSDQVSILNPSIHQGDLWGTLLRHIGNGLGMFFWSGDTIPRHNLPGRPIFDPIIAPFFLFGLVWAIRRWRRPAMTFMLLWTFLMLAPTILAEDTPHFFRAVGVLPMACLLPAVGMDQGWRWLETRSMEKHVSLARPNRLRWSARVLVLLILAASLGLTARDYVRYASDPITGYAFQSAAVELSREIDHFDGKVWASERFREEWESIPYLVGDRDVTWLSESELPRLASYPAALILWPYDPVEPKLAALPAGIAIQGWQGSLIKGDLEEHPYPLYWSYRLEPIERNSTGPIATFDHEIQLEEATCLPAETSGRDTLEIVLTWSAGEPLDLDYTAFVHVSDMNGIIAQDDTLPAGGTLPTTWWRPGDWIVDRHTVTLPSPYDPVKHDIAVGLYTDRERLAVRSSNRPVVDNAVILFPAPASD
jgi:4-amino-4-deoxy-L-arabinose transferase-like glycosyltransferase